MSVNFTTYYSPEKIKLYDADEVDSFVEELRDLRDDFSLSRAIEWVQALDRILSGLDRKGED